MRTNDPDMLTESRLTGEDIASVGILSAENDMGMVPAVFQVKRPGYPGGIALTLRNHNDWDEIPDEDRVEYEVWLSDDDWEAVIRDLRILLNEKGEKDDGRH